MADRVRHRVRGQRDIWRVGLLLSVLIHLILFLIFQTQSPRLTPYAAAGPPRGDDRAAAGGGGMRAIVLKPPVEITVPPQPRIPEPRPVEVETFEEPVLSLAELEEPDLGEGRREGPESGRGLPGGEGEGDAGNAMTGRRRLLPPTPRGMIFPFEEMPNSLKGREVTVWVFVNERGAVDSVRLEPPTPSRNYNELLKRQAREWVFDPAERAGQAVAGWYSYSWKL